MIRHMVWLGSVVVIAFAMGCSAEAPVETPASLQPTAEGAKYLLSAAPNEPQDVIPMRAAVADEQEVVVIGRIGGSQDPWVDGLAAFSIVDRSLAACTDVPGDTCPTPWDYCCVTDKLPGATTLVKVVDGQGELLTSDARKLLGLAPLQTVIVKGQAHKDEAGNVTIFASGIYVDPANPGQVPRGEHDHPAAHDHDHDHAEGQSTQHDQDELSHDDKDAL